MNWFSGKKEESTADIPRHSRLSTKARAIEKTRFGTSERLHSMLRMSQSEVRSGRYRTLLYRFLTDNLPVVSACIWTWVRLSAAPGEYQVVGVSDEQKRQQAGRRLERLSQHLGVNAAGNPVGLVTFLTELFTVLYRDGVFGGFLTVSRDGSGVDRFFGVDSSRLSFEEAEGRAQLILDRDTGPLVLNRPDFYYVALNGNLSEPLGRSMLKAVPFVAYIEQQLVDDMRRTSHNSGFHRLHVKITPPGRLAGESDSAYVDRINSYFDSTVSMIKSCEVDDNPVTWDNVAIEYIGPNTSRSVTNSWFLNHRAMVEDICSGTSLAPFLLGYSYGATTTWSAFKFDIVMRQVKSVQAEVADFLEWIGNIDLALGGLDARCRFVFDNTFAYQATEKVQVESHRVDNILRLFQAGLIDEATAREKAGGLI